MRPPCRSTIQAAMARPRPVPPPGAPGRPVEPLEQVGQVLRPDPRTVVLDHERCAIRLGTDRDTDAPVGRAVPDRVVDEDHHELPEPGRVAGHDGGLRIHDDPDAPVRGRLAHRGRAVGGDVAEVDRHVLERDRARIGAGQQQEVLDDGRHVADLVVDVLECRADRRDRLGAMPLEVFDAAPDDRQRGPQLVAGVRRELALAPEGGALVGQGLADRHEGAPGVDRPEPEGHEDHDDPAEQQDREHHVERPLLGDPVTHDLDGVRLAALGLHVLGEDAHGGLDGGRRPARGDPLGRQRCRADVAAVDPRRCHRVHVGQAVGEVEPALGQDVVVLADGQRDRAATASAAEQVAIRAGVIGRSGTLAGQARLDLVEPHVQLGRRRAGQGAGHREVERGCEDQQDDQRRPAAPQDEVAADVPDHPAVGGLGGEFRRGGLGRGQDPVRHLPDDSPRPGPSRSACRLHRACRGGSGRRHRPRSASPRR